MMIVIVVTLIATGTASSWKFAVLADSRATNWDNNGLGIASNTLTILAKDIKNQGVDLVIFTGDMAMSNDNIFLADEMFDSWKSVMMPLYNAGIPIYVIRGNHDCVTLGNPSENDSDLRNDPYLNHFPLPGNAISPDGGFTYSLIHKNAKFIGFDQYINRKASFDANTYAPGSNQGQMMNRWVTDQINISTSPLNFAFAHQPLFPSDSHPDSMANDPDSLDALVSALGSHHGAYFCGHDHLYLRANVFDGRGHFIPELIVGTAGSGNYNYTPTTAPGYSGPLGYAVDKVYSNSINPTFGYLLITVFDDNTWQGEFRGFKYVNYLSAEGYPEPIRVLDKFSVSKENEARSYNSLFTFLENLPWLIGLPLSQGCHR